MERSWANQPSSGAGRSGKRSTKGAQGNADSQRGHRGGASTQHWQAGFTSPGAPRGGAGNNGGYAARGKTTDQLTQSVVDLRNIADMGLRWGMEPELDQRVRHIVSDIGAVLSAAQQARSAAVDDVRMRFGVDFLEDGGGYATASPSRNAGLHSHGASDSVLPGHRTGPMWQEDILIEKDRPPATPPDDSLAQALGTFLRHPGPSSFSQQPQWHGHQPIPGSDPEELQRVYQAVQAMQQQGQQFHGGGRAAGAGNGEAKARSQYQPPATFHQDFSQEPQDYHNMGAYVGHPDNGAMGGMDVGMGIHMQEGPGNKVSVLPDGHGRHVSAAAASTSPATFGADPTRASAADARRLQMQQPSGYVVKNTFIEPAEDAEENEERQMRASAILFRSEQGLCRKQRYTEDIMEEDEDPIGDDDDTGVLAGGLERVAFKMPVISESRARG